MLIDALRAYTKTATPMHMPGHMRSEDYTYLNHLGAGLDITEIAGFDDLHNPSGILLDSMKEASKLWGSRKSRYLVNGSTCGILASVYALSVSGGRAVVSRNAHKSLYHALELTGIEPVFIESGFDEKIGACTDVLPESIEQALENAPNAKFVFITSPTYEGVISDIKKISEIAHRRGVPVIVDEAHGAHLGLTRDFPMGAVQAGADIVIQSVHKTLLSLTQTAILHVNSDRVSMNAIDHALDIFETSSPSYLLMASIDGCVQTLKEDKDRIFGAWRKNIDEFRAQVKSFRHVSLWKSENAFAFDESKLILTHPVFSGSDLMNLLRDRFSIELEAAYPRYAVAMTGAGTKKESLDKLFDALLQIDEMEVGHDVPSRSVAPILPERVFPIKDALFAPWECIPIDEAVGRVCAEYAWAYPPGVPVLAPGERITKNAVAVWQNIVSSGANTVKTKSEEAFFAVIKE